MSKEKWRWVDGYEGLYMVSDHGNVMSTPPIKLRTGPSNGILLKQSIGTDGYLHVVLSNHSVTTTQSVHRLVAESFISCPDRSFQVNHIDGNKKNNCLSNLEWVTQSQNTLHAYENGLMSKDSTKKLTPFQIREIRKHRYPDTEYARRFGVSKSAIRFARIGLTYKGVK